MRLVLSASASGSEEQLPYSPYSATSELTELTIHE